MGIYTEYLDAEFNWSSLTAERKKQLARISSARGGRPVFTFASAITKSKDPIAIDFDDLVPISDQISNIKGRKIDIILETPGGYAETVEDIVHMIRNRFSEVTMIVPGHAKSAGTIMVLAGDEIQLGPDSALVPIDAQIIQGTKRFSAFAFLEGLDKIKEEVAEVGLNRAYIPILQNISPGEIQTCANSLKFSKTLVTTWLTNYKFKFWKKHATSNETVTKEQKETRASEIAAELCNHGKWLTHGRSIHLEDLRKMGLKIEDFSKDSDLYNAIRRYYTLLKMSFDTTNIFKIYETPESQVYRYARMEAIKTPIKEKADAALLNISCPQCKTETEVQASFNPDVPVKKGAIPFPRDNKFSCPSCNTVIDISAMRIQIEAETKRPII